MADKNAFFSEMEKMNILYLTTKFPLAKASPCLNNDLCNSFVRLGHNVTVVNLDWHNDNKSKGMVVSLGALKLINVAPIHISWLPSKIDRMFSWFFSSLKAYSAFNKEKNKAFDVVFMTTPLTLYFLFLFFNGRRKHQCRIALCFDFFPLHQQRLGLLPGMLSAPLLLCEQFLYNSCEYIALLSDDYKSFLQSHYKIRSETKLVITGLWGEGIDLVSPISKEKSDIEGIDKSKIIVFGGQLSSGRGISNFVELAHAASGCDPKIMILLFITDKEKINFAESELGKAGLSNYRFMAPIPRNDYRHLIHGCRAGVISLESSINCPSFPSKIVDYLYCGLPVIVLDDNNPSLQRFITENEIGYYIHPGDKNFMKDCITDLFGNNNKQDSMSHNSKNIFNETMSPDAVIKQLLDNAKFGI